MTENLSKEKTFKRLSISLIILGITLRLIDYLHNKSLWLDETYVALNVMKRSFIELIQPPLLEHQAPIGFLWIQRFMINIFGANEYALRLYSLTAAIVSLFLFYIILKKITSKETTLIALSLFSICTALIHYSSEGKPYSGDVMITLISYLFAFDLLNNIIIGILTAKKEHNLIIPCKK